MFGCRLESNGFTRGKCIRLYTGYSSSKRLNNYDKSSAMFAKLLTIWLIGRESSVRVNFNRGLVSLATRLYLNKWFTKRLTIWF